MPHLQAAHAREEAMKLRSAREAGREAPGPPPQQPIEGALDRLAGLAELAAAEAGFFAGVLAEDRSPSLTENGSLLKSPARARGFEMGDALWRARSGKDEAVAVYHWPRGVVRIGVQTRTVEVEKLP